MNAERDRYIESVLEEAGRMAETPAQDSSAVVREVAVLVLLGVFVIGAMFGLVIAAAGR